MENMTTNRKQYKKCCRCGGIKSESEFRAGQKYWNEWCKVCESVPIGKISSGLK